MRTSHVKLSTIKVDEIRELLLRRAESTTARLAEARRCEDRAKWETIRRAKRENFDRFIRACGVPKLFEGVPPVEFNGRSIFITGKCGTGKTFKAVGILKTFARLLPCKEFVEPYKNLPIFVNTPELMMRLRGCFLPSAKMSEDALLRGYMETPLLVMDDLGSEKSSEWVLQSLYILTNSRYTEQRPIVITSNLSLEDLTEKLGDRITSRIAGMCRVIKLAGNDRRLR